MARPLGQECPGEAQLGRAMLSLLRHLEKRKRSSLNEPERKHPRESGFVRSHAIEVKTFSRSRSSSSIIFS